MVCTQKDHNSRGQQIRWLFRCLLLLAWVTGSMGLAGCAPTLYVKQSYKKTFSVYVVDGFVSLDNGVILKIAPILNKENVKPPPPKAKVIQPDTSKDPDGGDDKKDKEDEPNLIKVHVTRLLGSYLVTGDGFKHVWMIRPGGGNRGSYYPLKVPNVKVLRGVSFQYREEWDCVTLVLNKGVGGRFYIHGSGEIAGKCNDKAKKSDDKS